MCLSAVVANARGTEEIRGRRRAPAQTVLLCSVDVGEMPFDHAYPPGDWTVEEIKGALEAAPEAYPVPAYGAENRWAELRHADHTQPLVEDLIQRAETHRGEPPPPLPASLYLGWQRDGDRTYQQPSKARLTRLSAFALAECLEREGRFRDSILDYAWALCEQAGWSYPTNFDDAELVDGLPVEVPPEQRSVEIRKCEIGLLLAELDYLFGDRLHGALRERIRVETDRRLFRPYETRSDFHWFQPPAHNKNAVCHGRTLLAAMYLLDDTERQAMLLAKGIHNLAHYLACFDPDGCTPEGVGYWSFGFRHYTWLAAQLEARTAGELSLLSPPVTDEIARFPQRIELASGQYPPFSDMRPNVRLRPYVAGWLGDRLDIPWLQARAVADMGPFPPHLGLSGAIRDLHWCPSDPPDPPDRPGQSAFFSGHQWWVARTDPTDPERLSVAAKGGHNGEPHNHNDGGSFVIAVDGEMPLTDLGAPGYEQYHGGRYDALPARSLGHSVPYVNETEQAPGSAHHVEVLQRKQTAAIDRIQLELGSCYPAATGLETLSRSISLVRDEPLVRVEDGADFAASANGTELVSVLISYDPIEPTDKGLRVGDPEPLVNVTVAGDVDRSGIDVERLPDGVRARNWGGPAEYVTVWRATVPAIRAETPELTLEITPAYH